MVLEASLKEMNAQFPNYEQTHEKLQDLSDNKLYHQLTDVLMEYFGLDIWQQKAPCKALHTFFEGFVRKLGSKVNPLRFQHMLSICAEHVESPQAALEFIQSFKDEVESVATSAKLGVSIFFRSVQADFIVKAKDFRAAQALLDEIEDDTSKAYGVDASVYSRFYGSLMNLHEETKDFAAYFSAAVQYLNYTPLADIRNPADIAFKVILSCLVAPNEFDFGDLLHREILQTLENHPKAWAKELLVTFHNGKYQAFDEALKKHAAPISQVSELKDNENVLSQKFSLMALVELAFQQPKNQRKLDFKKIGSVCRVEQNRVEHLIMRAMSLTLIKGSIDQVHETLSFSWVKPRILDNQRLQLLQSRIETWHIQANSVLMQLEEMTPELLVS